MHYDPVALNAIKDHQSGLKVLSKERVWNEFQKILSTADPSRALLEMSRIGVLKKIWNDENIHNIKNLIFIEKKLAIEPEPIRRLVAISKNSESISLNFSRKDARKFSLLKGLLENKHDLAELVYQFSREIALSVLAIHTLSLIHI